MKKATKLRKNKRRQKRETLIANGQRKVVQHTGEQPPKIDGKAKKKAYNAGVKAEPLSLGDVVKFKNEQNQFQNQQTMQKLRRKQGGN